MNSLKNDKGEWVAQEGAPMSNARIKCEYPSLIEYLTQIYYGESRIDRAIDIIRNHPWFIKDEQLTLRILENTPFTSDTCFGIVKAVTPKIATASNDDKGGEK